MQAITRALSSIQILLLSPSRISWISVYKHFLFTARRKVFFIFNSTVWLQCDNGWRQKGGNLYLKGLIDTLCSPVIAGC